MEPDDLMSSGDIPYDQSISQSMFINELSERRKSQDKTRPTTPIIDPNNTNSNHTIPSNESFTNLKEKFNSTRPSLQKDEISERRPSKQDKEVIINGKFD